MTIRWLPEARTDIVRLHTFLSQKNPHAATRAIHAIREGALILCASPEIGRPMNDTTGQRELFIPFASGNYVLRYIRDPDGVPVILRVWHNREQRE